MNRIDGLQGHLAHEERLSGLIDCGTWVVERNALRAGLVQRAKAWRWGSLWRWLQAVEPDPALLSPWPIPRLPPWVAKLNQPLTEPELAAVRQCAQRGTPFGEPAWRDTAAERLGLTSTLRPRTSPGFYPLYSSNSCHSWLKRAHLHRAPSNAQLQAASTQRTPHATRPIFSIWAQEVAWPRPALIGVDPRAVPSAA